MEGVTLLRMKPQSLEKDDLNVEEEEDFGEVLERWGEKWKSRGPGRRALVVSRMKTGKGHGVRGRSCDSRGHLCAAVLPGAGQIACCTGGALRLTAAQQ